MPSRAEIIFRNFVTGDVPPIFSFFLLLVIPICCIFQNFGFKKRYVVIVSLPIFFGYQLNPHQPCLPLMPQNLHVLNQFLLLFSHSHLLTFMNLFCVLDPRAFFLILHKNTETVRSHINLHLVYEFCN